MEWEDNGDKVDLKIVLFFFLVKFLFSFKKKLCFMTNDFSVFQFDAFL